MLNWREPQLFLLWLALACNGDGSDAATLEGVTACERFSSLARAKGCDPPASCNIPESCADEAVAWIDCAATNLDQCICESDGDLNCEGSWKPNEGPAQCIAEHSAVDACETP
jgi:hypothetical protein